MARAYHRSFGLPVMTTRYGNNYGRYQFPETFLPLFIMNAMDDQPLPLYGDGQQRRDWLYVEDNADAILLVLERGEDGSIYNVAAGEERANLEVVSLLCKFVAEETGGDLQGLLKRVHLVTDRPGHDRRYSLDATKIKSELGWRPKITL